MEIIVKSAHGVIRKTIGRDALLFDLLCPRCVLDHWIGHYLAIFGAGVLMWFMRSSPQGA
jgi:hypothetical protein